MRLLEAIGRDDAPKPPRIGAMPDAGPGIGTGVDQRERSTPVAYDREVLRIAGEAHQQDVAGRSLAAGANHDGIACLDRVKRRQQQGERARRRIPAAHLDMCPALAPPVPRAAEFPDSSGWITEGARVFGQAFLAEGQVLSSNLSDAFRWLICYTDFSGCCVENRRGAVAVPIGSGAAMRLMQRHHQRGGLPLTKANRLHKSKTRAQPS